MNIALCHYRVGETDGVSLEMEKWKTVLEKLGHQVFFLTGSKGSTEGYVIPELGYRQEKALQLEYSAYQQLDYYQNERDFIIDLNNEKDKIKYKLKSFILEKNISLLIPNNILSLGKNIAAAIAFSEIIEEEKIKCIGHHHDFYWERESFSKPSCPFVVDSLCKYFPPDLELIKHVVINSQSGEELKKRKGFESTIVPNVFDFGQKLWKKDNYNNKFRKEIGVNDNDILILQATRVTDRKAIELAVDLISELNKLKKGLFGKIMYNGEIFREESRIILVMVGMIESTSNYVQKLKARADSKQVKLVFCSDIVDYSRKQEKNKNIYSLWDTYVNADFITYPSILEGWGNQFLEGLFACKPMAVFEYEVFQKDIKDKGFNIVSLGSEYYTAEDKLVKIKDNTIKRAAGEVVELLFNRNSYLGFVKENFELGRKYYSYQLLEELLEDLIRG